RLGGAETWSSRWRPHHDRPQFDCSQAAPSSPSPYTRVESRASQGGVSMRKSSRSKSHRRCSAGFVSLVGITLLLVVAAPAQARRKDQVPPTFAGLKSVTTCIPGPIG